MWDLSTVTKFFVVLSKTAKLTDTIFQSVETLPPYCKGNIHTSYFRD